jgi:hypothetical protein
VYVARLVGSVVLGPSLQVRVADDAGLLEHPQGPIDGGGVDCRHPALDPAGHVLGRDVPLGLEHLLKDGLALRGDAIAALPERRRHGSKVGHVAGCYCTSVAAAKGR